ncbi:MAG: hypothetical protein AAGD38_19130 [Acidobacteriota bacterium]
MTLLIVTLLLGAALLVLLRAERQALRIGAVAVIVALPLVYAATLIGASAERLDALRFSRVGVQLAFGEGRPLTIGGGDTAADLHANLLPADAGLIEVAGEADSEAIGATIGEPILRLPAADGTAPVIVVDGVVQNAISLTDGDVIRLGEDIELTFGRRGLRVGDAEAPLPGLIDSLVGNPNVVVYLPDLGTTVGLDLGDYRSFLQRQGNRWRLVLRDSTVTVMRNGETVAALADRMPLAREVALGWQVVWGTPGNRVLRTLRSDRLTFEDERVTVFFDQQEHHLETLAGADAPIELALVVPSTVDTRGRLVEFAERSPRLSGLSATLTWDPESKVSTLELLGDRQEVALGSVYGLGEGDDLLLVRIDRTRVPWRLLLDLALLGLFFAVFLGPGMLRVPTLAVTVGATGLIIANRLLFAHRAATQPPDFYVRGIDEAQLALWLVPAALLFGWTFAWLCRRPTTPELSMLRWPLLGLVTAAAGCFTVAGGRGTILALIPLVLAGLLVLASRISSLRRDALPWSLRTALIVAVLVFAVRTVAAWIGMPEALRLPTTGLRVLWTAIQLPVCALALGLTLDLIADRRDRLGVTADHRPVVRAWLAGIITVLGFATIAYALTAAMVRDLGLLIAHGLPVVVGLLLLVRWPPWPARSTGKPKITWAVGTGLAMLPLLAVLTVNVAPSVLVSMVGWGSNGDQETTTVVDRAAQLSANRAQQMFRLYMLANPELLREVGLVPSERVAIHYGTLQSYGAEAGFWGEGFASSELPRHLGVTYLSDLVPMVFVLADFGVIGMVGLTVVYLALLIPLPLLAADPRGAPITRQGTWIATVALLAVVLPSLYMILANLNLVLFTGKNTALLSLNSISDILESAALLAIAAWGLGLARR